MYGHSRFLEITKQQVKRQRGMSQFYDIFWKEFSGERNPNPQNAIAFLTFSFTWHEGRTLQAAKQHAPLIEADSKCEVYPLQNIDTVMKGV
jgi:hypothetical protein